MAKINYLIPKPSVENAVNTGYKGTLIYSETQYRRSYYVLQKDTENAWWAIGMIAKVGNYDHPIIVSDQRNNVHTICDGGGGQSTIGYEMTYDGVTYYVNGNTAYATDTASGFLLINNIIPYYSESTFSDTEDGYKLAGQKLLDLYKSAGGNFPVGDVKYSTAWIKKQIDGNYQKSFTYAHAKTVYTDYAHKKTLADKLSEIDTEIGNKANKTEIPTDLPANGGNSLTVNGHTVKSDVPENAVFTDTVYDDTEVKESISNQSKEIMSIKNTANFSHNIPRNVPKDITSYIADGTFYKRLNGTDGFELFEDIYVGDYIKMSRAITCPDSTGGTVGSQYVTIAGLDTMMYNGEDGKYVNYHHAVMVPGQGFKGTQHFGIHAMNATNTTEGGYAGSVMDQSVLGAVVTEGSTDSGATINQQLYAEFGSHLKTTDELLSTSINATGVNRFGTANGCSNNWGWSMRQAVLMSEVEVYGSAVWSSSGYDTGSAKMQLPLFAHSRNAMNDRRSWYWLKDVASSAGFCSCDYYGGANYGGAGRSWYYVRPRFIIAA